MFTIDNGIYSKVAIKWNTITFPLKAGTPISKGGTIANNGNAIGLVPQTFTEKPLMGVIYVLVGGEVVTAEVNKSSGYTLEESAKKAMNGIKFYGADGTPEVDPIYDMPIASASKLGGVKIGTNISVSTAGVISVADASASAKGLVKQSANVAEAAGDAPTAAEFKALLDALIAAGIMAEAETE